MCAQHTIKYEMLQQRTIFERTNLFEHGVQVPSIGWLLQTQAAQSQRLLLHGIHLLHSARQTDFSLRQPQYGDFNRRQPLRLRRRPPLIATKTKRLRKCSLCCFLQIVRILHGLCVLAPTYGITCVTPLWVAFLFLRGILATFLGIGAVACALALRSGAVALCGFA